MSKWHHPTGYHPLQKMKIILTGIRVAFLSDFSVAYKLVISIPVIMISFLFRQWIDITLIVLVTGLMVICELFNSAIEMLCDFIEEQENPKIARIKDIAAAAAGISILVWILTLILEGSHLWQVSQNA